MFSGTYSPYSVTISFDTSLSGSQLDGLNLFDITSTVSNFMETNNIPGTGSATEAVLISTDGLGNITGFSITNTNGDIVTQAQDTGPAIVGGYEPPPQDLAGFGECCTSNSGGVLFGSYPAFSGENPDDFFCTYSDSSGHLITDNDAGFCPANAVSTGSTPGTTASGSGSFSSNPNDPGGATAPEPAAWAMMGVGFLGLAGLRRFRTLRV
jgi:hypothetical protein